MKGFSLLEAVISIGVLSLISVFILQMFISAANLNTRAKDSDTAASKAITAIENFKKNPGFDSSITLFYYDKEWNGIDTDTASIPADARYCLRLEITETDETAYGKLYDVAADVTEISPGENDRVLASLWSKKYFSGTLAEGM